MQKNKINRLKTTASCLCGGVTFTIQGALRHIINCYCKQCRKTHGLMGPYTQSCWTSITFHNKKDLKWYISSNKASRGFCKRCGSSIFWRPKAIKNQKLLVSISAGVLDNSTNLKLQGHIYTDYAPDFYTLPDDGLPHFTGSSCGKLDNDLAR